MIFRKDKNLNDLSKSNWKMQKRVIKDGRFFQALSHNQEKTSQEKIL